MAEAEADECLHACCRNALAIVFGATTACASIQSNQCQPISHAAEGARTASVVSLLHAITNVHWYGRFSARPTLQVLIRRQSPILH